MNPTDENYATAWAGADGWVRDPGLLQLLLVLDLIREGDQVVESLKTEPTQTVQGRLDSPSHIQRFTYVYRYNEQRYWNFVAWRRPPLPTKEKQ